MIYANDYANDFSNHVILLCLLTSSHRFLCLSLTIHSHGLYIILCDELRQDIIRVYHPVLHQTCQIDNDYLSLPRSIR